MKTKTFVCLHCFSYVEITCQEDKNGTLEDCPVCGNELKEVPNPINVSSVKYYMEKLLEYL